MEFRPVRLEDKAAIERFTRPSGICNCDLAFANMYCWEGTYRSAWCVEEGFLLIRFYIDGSHHIGYMQPLGEGDFTHLIPRLEADARAAGQPLRISGLTPEGAAAVRRAHPEFGIWRNRDYEDYVYRADDLRNLTGRRYQPKRNHINRFEAAYDYRYEELTPALAPECMRLEREWRAGHDSHAAELTAEQRAMQRAFDHFGELELRGGALFVGEKLVAFTIGSAINDEAFCIHVEKADTRYDGAFTMINRLFAQHLPPHYTLIDREEDLGLEGLRQSKLSYHPLFLQPKLTAQRLTEEQWQRQMCIRDSSRDWPADCCAKRSTAAAPKGSATPGSSPAARSCDAGMPASVSRGTTLRASARTTTSTSARATLRTTAPWCCRSPANPSPARRST